MNAGILRKSWRECWPVTLIAAGAMLAFHGLLAFALPKLQAQLQAQLDAIPFLQTIIQAMVGADVSGGAGPQIFATIPWVHPVVLAVAWAHAIVLTTRMPAGEVDRGTIDLLLSLPVARGRVLATESMVAGGCCGMVIAAAVLGNATGARLGGNTFRVPVANLVPAALGLVSLTLAVGAFATLVSCLSDRRGRALLVIVGVVLASFLLNYLAQFWSPARAVAWLSILRYHQPLSSLHGGAWPWRDWAVLWGVAACCVGAAGVVFSRRDLTTT